MLPVIDTIFAFLTIFLPLYAIWHCRWRTGMPTPDASSILNHLRTGGEPELLRQYLIAPTILALVADAIWLTLRVRLARRAHRILRGEEEHQGLLHPGMALVVLLSCAADMLLQMGGVSFAQGAIGYVTNILVGVAMILMAVVLTILARMETGLPQPQDDSSERN